MKTKKHDVNQQLLKALYFANCDDGAFYKNSSVFVKRIFFRSFFRRLSSQKKSFCSALKILILNRMENESSDLSNYSADKPNSSSSCFHYFDFKRNRNKVIKECYRKELEALAAYESALVQLKDNQIRATLEVHLQEIRLILNEMKVMGTSKFLV